MPFVDKAFTVNTYCVLAVTEYDKPCRQLPCLIGC